MLSAWHKAIVLPLRKHGNDGSQPSHHQFIKYYKFPKLFSVFYISCPCLLIEGTLCQYMSSHGLHNNCNSNAWRLTCSFGSAYPVYVGSEPSVHTKSCSSSWSFRPIQMVSSMCSENIQMINCYYWGTFWYEKEVSYTK